MTIISIIPKGYRFDNYILTIPNTNPYINDLSYIYGSYIVSSSSTDSSKNNLPYNAFNNSSNTYWESEKMDKINKYKQFAFTNSEPASYVGGGTDSNTWKTIVNNNNILGEWIQIQIPYKLYLDNYSLLSHPIINEYSTVSDIPETLKQNSPKQFYVLGSNDGVKWNIIDQRNLLNVPMDLNKATTYYVNTRNGYSYFRLVINQLFKGDNIKLYQFNLFGYVNSISGKIHKIENYANYENTIKNNNPNIYMQHYKPFSNFEPLYQTFNVVETFDASGVDLERIRSTSNSINLKLNTLNELNDGVNQNYNELRNRVQMYKNLRHDLEIDKKYDYSGKVLQYTEKKNTLADGLDEDLKIMIVEENNLFILGTIAMATLLIGILVISKD